MTYRSYAVIVAGFFTVSIAYAIRYAYGLLLPEMLPDLNITKTEAGAVFSTYFVVYTIGTPILGALSDRYGYRFILTLFSAILAMGALLMAHADSLLKAYLYFSLAGLGHTACWAPVTGLVQRWVADRKRGFALSLVTMGVSLGMPVWSLVLPSIVTAAGWRSGWLAMGLFGLGVSALNFALVRTPDAPNANVSPVRSSYRALLRYRSFWIIGTAYLLVGFNVLIPFTFLPVYAKESIGLSYVTATRLVAVMTFCGFLGSLALGSLSDILGRIKVLVICGLILGMGCLGMTLFRGGWLLFAVTGFYGMGYGAVWPVYAAAASDFYPRDQTGGVVGLWTVFLGMGSIISPVVCGWTIDVTGNYTWTFLLGLLSGMASAVVLLGVLLGKRERE